MPARARKRTAKPAPGTVPPSKATAKEVAVYLKRTQGTLANWRSQGKGPRWSKPGGSIRYDWADVYAWENDDPDSGADARQGAA